MKKKILAIVLAGAMLLGMAACGNDAPADAPADQPAVSAGDEAAQAPVDDTVYKIQYHP